MMFLVSCKNLGARVRDPFNATRSLFQITNKPPTAGQIALDLSGKNPEVKRCKYWPISKIFASALRVVAGSYFEIALRLSAKLLRFSLSRPGCDSQRSFRQRRKDAKTIAFPGYLF